MHKTGLIGLGKIAVDRHVPTIAANPDFELAGVADLQADISRHGVPGFRSHMDMLSALPELDCVAICTPPGARYRIAADAIAAGKHVLLEKPPTMTTAELASLRDAAEQAGVVLFTAWHSQFNGAVADLQARLEGQAIESLTVTWTEDVHRHHPGQDWIWRDGGFGVFDPGINALSVLTRILPRRLSVHGAELLIPADAETPIAARVEFGIDDSATPRGRAVFDWRAEAGELREIIVTTRAGTALHLTQSGRRLSVDGTLVVDGDRAEYKLLYEHFGQLLRTGRSDVDSAPLALTEDALRLGERMTAAALT